MIQIERRGTVHMAWIDRNVWSANWEAEPDDDPECLGAVTAPLGEVLEWARARSRRIVMRARDGRVYWEGEDPMPEDPDLAGYWRDARPDALDESAEVWFT